MTRTSTVLPARPSPSRWRTASSIDPHGTPGSARPIPRATRAPARVGSKLEAPTRDRRAGVVRGYRGGVISRPAGRPQRGPSAWSCTATRASTRACTPDRASRTLADHVGVADPRRATARARRARTRLRTAEHQRRHAGEPRILVRADPERRGGTSRSVHGAHSRTSVSVPSSTSPRAHRARTTSQRAVAAVIDRRRSRRTLPAGGQPRRRRGQHARQHRIGGSRPRHRGSARPAMSTSAHCHFRLSTACAQRPTT